MRMIPIRSKMLAGLGYDPGTETLVAQFNGGKLYRYDGVPPDTFVAIITDKESHGKAFNEKVKNVAFPYEEVEPKDVLGL